MKSFRIWFIVALVAMTSFSSYILFNRGISVGARRDAIAMLHSQTEELNKENTQLYDDNEKLAQKIENANTEYDNILENDSEFAKYNEDVQALEGSIEKIKQEISTLDTSTVSGEEYAEEILKVSNAAKGDTVTFTDSTLECPKDISPGRYKIEGQGSFRIINNANNNITETQNVKSLESNSYTCMLEDNSRLVIDGSLKLTEVD